MADKKKQVARKKRAPKINTSAIVSAAKWIPQGNARVVGQLRRDEMMAETLTEMLARPGASSMSKETGDCYVEVTRDTYGTLTLTEMRPVRSAFLTEATLRASRQASKEATV